MSLYVQVPIKQIADGLTAIGWLSAGGGGDATLSYGSIEPTTPVNGTLWYDTTATLLKLYTGGTWTTINVSAETIATISGYATSAQASANTATQKLTEFKAIQVIATTLSAGASATASYNSGTGVITLGIPTGETGSQGIAGVDGISGAQLNTANTFTAPQRTAIIAQTNAINFTLKNNFIINATVGIISASNLTGCIGQGGVIVIESAENITGWSAEFVFKDIPTYLNGLEVFSYFVQTETIIRIGRVS